MQEMRVDAFTDALAAKVSVPGGGGASALAGALGMELEDQGSSLGSSTYWLAIAKFTAVRQEKLLVPPTSSDSSEDEMRYNGQTKTCSS